MKIQNLAILMLFLLGGFHLTMMIWHPMPYNTETVCFDDNGSIILYASGYKPGTCDDCGNPIIHISGDKYKIRETGELIEAACRSIWGVNPPRGREYWETSK